MQRRQFLQTSALATALLGGMPLSATAKSAKGKVVVIGGGYGSDLNEVAFRHSLVFHAALSEHARANLN